MMRTHTFFAADESQATPPPQPRNCRFVVANTPERQNAIKPTKTTLQYTGTQPDPAGRAPQAAQSRMKTVVDSVDEF